MDIIYRDFIQLLRSFVSGTEPKISNVADWDKLLLLSKIHSVRGILGYLNKQYHFPIDERYKKILEDSFASTAVQSVNKEHQMEKLIGRLTAENIDHLLFKGYVVKRFYPLPELRTFGDIDFIIRPEDRNKSHQLMFRLGYQPEADFGEVFVYSKGIEHYEIHTGIMTINVSGRSQTIDYFQNPWKQAQLKQGCTYEFTPEYHLIYLICHIAKHMSGHGAGIRMYLDIALFLKYYEGQLDWEYIKTEMLKLNLEQFLNTVLYAVQIWFGMVAPIVIEPVEEGVFKEFQNYTLSAGVFGFQNREVGLYRIRKQISQGKKYAKSSAFITRLFPSASSIESRYTFLKNKHWLLPVAWVVRFFVTYKDAKKNVKELKGIASADSNEAERINKILEKIGL